MEKVKNMRKRYLMIDDFVPDKVLGKIKEIIGIEKILIDTDDKLPDDITLKCCDINDMRYKR